MRSLEEIHAPRLADGPVGSATMGDFVLAEWTDDGSSPGRPQAPPHVHLGDDEAWYVLEGRLVIRVGDEDLAIGAGGAVVAPAGTAHTFWNPDPSPARYLVVMRPRTARLVEALHDGRARDTEATRALFAEHGVTVEP